MDELTGLLKNQMFTILAIKNDNPLIMILMMCCFHSINYVIINYDILKKKLKKLCVKTNSVYIVIDYEYFKDHIRTIPHKYYIPVLKHLKSLNLCGTLEYKNESIVLHNNFKINSKLTYSSVLDKLDKEGNIKTKSFCISSTKMNIKEINDWIEDIYKKHTETQTNTINQTLCIFNEIINTKNKNLEFDMIKLNTFKTFDNVFGEHFDILKNRVDFFINNQDWYQKKGIPYHLGIMLHGEKGCGKTSTIKVAY